MYTTREEIREKKKWAPQGRGGFPGGTLPRGEPCRRRRQGGKEKAGERAKSMYILYAYFFLFFCSSLQTQKGMVLLCISLCIHKKEKHVYVKLHTANKAGVMRAYVYVCILKKCSGWFRCADFRKFCTGLFAYFFCWQPAAIPAGSRRSMYVYMYKKENKMYMFTYTKKRTKCICLRIQNLKWYA